MWKDGWRKVRRNGMWGWIEICIKSGKMKRLEEKYVVEVGEGRKGKNGKLSEYRQKEKVKDSRKGCERYKGHS